MRKTLVVNGVVQKEVCVQWYQLAEMKGQTFSRRYKNLLE
jgi:hypothetical protein